MDAIDALILTLLAVADIALMVHLRRSRSRRVREDRMMRSLQTAVQRHVESLTLEPVQSVRLRRAS
jgi:hypothetical protein